MDRLILIVILATLFGGVSVLAQDKQVVIERVEINGKAVTKDLRVSIKTKDVEFEAKTNADGFIVPG